MELTAEQKAEAERQEAISLDGQIREFRGAIHQAPNTVNLEIAAKDGQPQIDAVTRALLSVHADFIAKEPDRNARRLQMHEAANLLPKLVALRTANGQG